MFVCGYTHMQFDRMIGNIRVVNAGGVGMPYGEPGGYWFLLSGGVRLQQTGYDLNQAAACICSSGYPFA